MLTGLDIYRLLPELKRVEGKRIEKIYRINDIFVIKTGAGFIILRPGGVYLSSYAPKAEKAPDSFVMLLRKLFSGKRVESIEQINFDRILKICSTDACIVYEAFGKGNLIVISKDGKIIAVLRPQKFRHREIKVGVSYVPPPAPLDLRKITEEDLKFESKSEAAKKLGLGKLIEEVWSNDRSEMLKKIKELLQKPLSSRDVEKMFLQKDLEELRKKRLSEHMAKIKRLEKSIEEQERLISEYERKAKELRKVASWIFQNLQKVEELIEKARKEGKKVVKLKVE